MTDFLIYDLKVAALICVFYMFYRLLLSYETFHRVNRVVLLLTAAASVVLPLCVITIHKTVQIQAMPEVGIGEMQIAVAEPDTPYWQMALPALYIIGLLVTLGHTLLSLLKIVLLIRRSEQHPQPDGTVICVTGNAEIAPCSWMRYIVMNRGDYEAQNAAILAHERGHIRLRHSWDILLVNLLTALQWFNPAMWMLRQDLRAIHEYEADGEVLSQGINARQYQYLLISKAAGIGGYSIANGIAHSTLKKRILMMTNKKSKSNHLWKLLAVVPIVGIALALNAQTVTDYVYNKPQPQQPAEATATSTEAENAKAAEPAAKTTNQPAEPKGTPRKINILVIDGATHSPALGATAKIVGSKQRVVTDLEGKASLDTKVGDQVEITLAGRKPVTVTVPPSEKDQNRQWAVKLELQEEQDDQDPILEEVPQFPGGVEQEQDDQDPVLDICEELPQFPGGVEQMWKYLMENLRYPEEAMKKGIQGRVIVTFTIRKDGSITDIHVPKPVDPLLDAEAERVVSDMPKWTPGKQKGKPVSVKYTIPVTFRLS